MNHWRLLTEKTFNIEKAKLFKRVPKKFHNWLSRIAIDNNGVFDYNNIMRDLTNYVDGLLECLADPDRDTD